MISYVILHVGGVIKNASSGNRTRATTLATLYSTTEPMTLVLDNQPRAVKTNSFGNDLA